MAKELIQQGDENKWRAELKVSLLILDMNEQVLNVTGIAYRNVRMEYRDYDTESAWMEKYEVGRTFRIGGNTRFRWRRNTSATLREQILQLLWWREKQHWLITLAWEWLAFALSLLSLLVIVQNRSKEKKRLSLFLFVVLESKQRSTSLSPSKKKKHRNAVSFFFFCRLQGEGFICERVYYTI